jgi:hypothetical protein
MEGHSIKDVGTFYGHLFYFMDICSILWTFVLFYGHLFYFMDICSILLDFYWIKYKSYLVCAGPLIPIFTKLSIKTDEVSLRQTLFL